MLQKPRQKSDKYQMKVGRVLIVTMSVGILLLTFQNCSPGTSDSFGKASSFNLNLSSGGNGGVYDGKPNTYYRFIPNYTCDGQPSAAQIVNENQGIFSFLDIQSGQCSPSPVPIPSVDIGVSPFQKEFISIRDELFMRYEGRSSKIPDVLPEVLCRDTFENPTFELISHFNRETNEAVTRVYSQNSSVPDFAVSRILALNSVQYVSSRLKFSVDFSKISQATKKYSGQIEFSSMSEMASKKVTCIIGGSLDTSSWTFQDLTTRDVENFSILDNGAVSFSSYVYTAGRSLFTMPDLHLYTVGLAPAARNEKDLMQSFSSGGYTLNYASPTPLQVGTTQLLFFSARPRDDYVSISSFLWDVESSRLVSLTNLNSRQFNSVWEYTVDYPAVKVSSSDEIVYPVNRITGNIGTLRSYNRRTGQVKNLLSISGKLKFRLLPNSGQALIASTNGSITEFGLFSLSSHAYRHLSVQPPSGCSLHGEVLDVLKNERGFLQRLKCGDTVAQPIAHISLIDGNLQTLGTSGNFMFSSSDSKWAFFKVDSSRSSIVVNLENFNVQSSPIFPTYLSPEGAPFFEEGLWYGMDSASASPRLIRTDLRTQKSTAMCAEAQGKVTSVGAISAEKIYILTFDSSQKIHRLYRAKNENECVRINEFPSTYSSSYVVSANEVGFAMVLQNPITSLFSSGPNEIVFVPTDGRPPLKLSPNIAGWWTIGITPDSKNILIFGPDQTGKKTLKVFNYNSRP